jgi:hypothetical protein
MEPNNQDERREHRRFPIVCPVSYRIADCPARSELFFGHTIDISSSGVLFLAEAPMRPGDSLELSISWPAQLDGKYALKLLARGRITRCLATEVAIEMLTHEFRTQTSLAGTIPGVWREQRAAWA